MAIPDEPSPLSGALPPALSWPGFDTTRFLTRDVREPRTDFFAVLAARRSGAGGRLAETDLASLLWHALLLRERDGGSRFGRWESRTVPAAGGLHSIGILCLPVDEPAALHGLYDPDEHLLRSSEATDAAIVINREEIAAILGAHRGTTLQFVGDRRRYEACYGNWETLFWRDAGVLAGFVALIATALGLRAVPVGRNGTAVIETAGFGSRYLAGGAVHVGSGQDGESGGRDPGPRKEAD